MDQEMVIFTRVFDLLEWLLPKSERFPRPYRATVTQRLIAAALDLQEALAVAEARAAGWRRCAMPTPRSGACGSICALPTAGAG